MTIKGSMAPCQPARSYGTMGGVTRNLPLIGRTRLEPWQKAGTSGNFFAILRKTCGPLLKPDTRTVRYKGDGVIPTGKDKQFNQAACYNVHEAVVPLHPPVDG